MMVRVGTHSGITQKQNNWIDVEQPTALPELLYMYWHPFVYQNSTTYLYENSNHF